MASDIYLKIAGVEGEAQAAGFENQIEILAFNWGAANPSTMNTTGSGLAAGRVEIQGFTINKRTDKSSARLFAACCKGEHFDNMVVSLRKATGEGGQGVFLTFTFNNVLVEHINWGASTGGDDVAESVSFAFAKVEIEYKMQKTKGGALEVAGQAAWDLKAVKS